MEIFGLCYYFLETVVSYLVFFPSLVYVCMKLDELLVLGYSGSVEIGVWSFGRGREGWRSLDYIGCIFFFLFVLYDGSVYSLF